jgi:pyruvate/2-oxoglutarate dehydrogenase complex dihydrolipoamide acyltransferase (E2) component
MDKKSIYNNGNQEKIKSFLNKIAVSLFNNKTQYDAEIDIDFNVDYKTNKINKKDSLYISIGRPRNEIIITNEGEIENILISTLTFSFNPINLPEESAAKAVDDIKTIIEEPLLLNI